MVVADRDQRVVGPPKMYKARVLNLENGLPTVEEGRKRLLEEVKLTKQNGGARKATILLKKNSANDDFRL
jgi:hypothetical protein